MDEMAGQDYCTEHGEAKEDNAEDGIDEAEEDRPDVVGDEANDHPSACRRIELLSTLELTVIGYRNLERLLRCVNERCESSRCSQPASTSESNYGSNNRKSNHRG